VRRLALGLVLLAAAPTLAAQGAKLEKLRNYEAAKSWVADVTFRRTVTWSYKIGDAQHDGREILEGHKSFTATNMDTDGQSAVRWWGDNTGHETLTHELHETITMPGVKVESNENTSSTFQNPNNWVEVDYSNDTFRAGTAGSDPIDSFITSTITTELGTRTETTPSGLTSYQGDEGPVEQVPVPVPPDEKSIALIGGRTRTLPKASPSGIPPEMEAMVQGTTVTWEETWSIVPQYDDTVLVVDIDDYEKWIPKGNKNELAEGNRLHVTAKIESASGGPSSKKATWMRFELLRTSREPGVCLNWPKEPDPPSFDLKFSPEQAVGTIFDDAEVSRLNDRQTAQTFGGPYSSVPMDISCYDYGAWSWLRVTARLTDGRTLVGYLRGQPDNRSITIPRRETGSYIATAWKEGRKGADVPDSSDAEHTPDNEWDGDGFSLYEEYRGFFQNGLHRRFDPAWKELCILDLVKGQTIRGFRAFQRGSGILVRHDFIRDEFRDDRIMNFNRSMKSPRRTQENQTGLIVVGASNGGGLTHIEGGHKRTVPKYVTQVDIDASSRTDGLQAVKIFGVTFVQDLNAKVLAHELGHACGAEHHGGTDLWTHLWYRDTSTLPPHIEDVQVQDSSGWLSEAAQTHGPIRVFRERDGVEIPWSDKVFDDPTARWIANFEDSQHSGDAECFMRYVIAQAYVDPNHRPNGRILVPEKEVIGTKFCKSPVGTHMNDPGHPPRPRYGDAVGGRGSCYQILCVNDSASPW
jgi:hypothetical protein